MNEPFIVSREDYGAIEVWDLQVFDKGKPMAIFNHHKGPVTSVEFPMPPSLQVLVLTII